MTSTLTKDIKLAVASSYVPGVPAVEGRPGYWTEEPVFSNGTTKVPNQNLVILGSNPDYVLANTKNYTTARTRTVLYTRFLYHPPIEPKPEIPAQPAVIEEVFQFKWNGGAVSQKSVEGNGYLKFTPKVSDKGAVMIGIGSSKSTSGVYKYPEIEQEDSPGWVNSEYNSSEFGFYIDNEGYKVRQVTYAPMNNPDGSLGSMPSSYIYSKEYLPYTSSSVFEIARIGSSVFLIVDGVNVETFTDAFTGSMDSYVSFFKGGDAVSDVTFEQIADQTQTEEDYKNSNGITDSGVELEKEETVDILKPKYIAGLVLLKQFSISGQAYQKDAHKAKLNISDLNFSGSANYQIPSQDYIDGNFTYQPILNKGGYSKKDGIVLDDFFVVGVSLPTITYRDEDGNLKAGFSSMFLQSPDDAYSVIANGVVNEPDYIEVSLPITEFSLFSSDGDFLDVSYGSYEVAGSIALDDFSSASLSYGAYGVSASGSLMDVAQIEASYGDYEMSASSGDILEVSYEAYAVSSNGSLFDSAGVFVSYGDYAVNGAVLDASWGTVELSYEIQPEFDYGAQIEAIFEEYGISARGLREQFNPCDYEGYCTNLVPTNTKDGALNFQTTRFEKYPFDNIVRFGNKYYGINAMGMYELGCEHDDGAAICWSFQTHLDSFGSYSLKTPKYAYISGRIPSTCDIVLGIGEDENMTYTQHTVQPMNAGLGRAVLGKGNKNTYYSIGMRGNGYIHIDNINLDIDVLSRGIR